MNPLTSAILKSGVIPFDRLVELRRFGAPIDLYDVPQKSDEPQSLEQVSQSIEEALQSEGLVLTKETDLEVLRAYMETQRVGLLHLELDDENKTEFEVTFGLTKLNEYILPWRGESISELVANGLSYLEYDAGRIVFTSVREVFFGSVKAFIICSPGPLSVRKP